RTVSRSLLLYDADCAFCTRAAQQAPRLGLRLTIAALQSVDLDALGVSADRARREIPFVDERGKVSYGGEAIARALGTGNLWWRCVSRAMRVRPLRYANAGIYRVVARNRHRLPGGTAACELPTDAGN
ncbi:MAG: DCC1-like thiol-disulfide oxidoreductase family protein, partial [Nakamurella sp.]